MANNIEPTFFSEDEISEIFLAHPNDCVHFLSGVVNQRIKKLKDALEAELGRGRASEINYARALGQIDGLKHTVEILAGKKAEWRERDLYD